MRISGEAYDINKQKIHIAPKSKIELRTKYLHTFTVPKN